MKKIFYVTVFAMIVFCSCSKNEAIKVEKPKSIEYGVYVGMQPTNTKATVAEIDNETYGLKATGFGVVGYYTGSDDISAAVTNNEDDVLPDFMYNVEILYNTSTNLWESENVKYWPNTNAEKISFFAYAPYKAVCPIKDEKGYPKLDYTVNEANANQEDLLVASAVNQTKLDGQDPNIVEFVFNHALSRIGFAAKNTTTSTSSDVIKITSLKVDLTGVKKNGIFTYSDNFGSSAWTTPLDTKHTATEDEVVGSAVSINKEGFTRINADDKYLMLIPQTLLLGNVKITVFYSIVTEWGEELTGYVVTSKELPAQTWEKGKSYLYNLKFDLDNLVDKISFDVTSVTEWVAGTQPGDINMHVE